MSGHHHDKRLHGSPVIIATLFVFWLLFVEFRMTGGRHTPALYFLLYMSGLMIVSDLLAGVASFSVPGFFFLAIVSGMFWLGHLCGGVVFGNLPGNRQHGHDNEGGDRILETFAMPPVPFILGILVIAGGFAAILAVAALVQAARSAGIVIANIDDLAKLPAYYSSLRYTVGIESPGPPLVQFCTPILSSGAAAGGLLRTFRTTRRQQIFQFLPLAFGLLLTLTTGARSYFFVNCTWFFGSFIAVLCVRGTVFEQLRSPGFLLKAVLLLSIAFLFGSSFELLRYSAQNLQAPTFDQFWTQLQPIMAASLAAIVTATLVFDRVTHLGVPLHLAAYTFAPIMAHLGLEAVRYPPDVFLTNGESDSNQYALVGYLLMDFGPLITAIIFCATGFLAAAAVHLIRAGVLSILPLLVAIICVILFSLITNFFFFTTHVFIFIGMTLAAIILQRLQLRNIHV